MKKFIIHWVNGTTEEITGTDISNAFMLAGYGGGALSAMDYWEETKEDLGIIDYVEREAGWMSESGISVGHMRILDDDDPEDVKASDLADKIFNSEENKPTFVYIVNIDSRADCCTDTEIKVFSTYEKAKAYFDECVSEEKTNDHLMKLDDKVVCDEENYFSVHQDGYWSEDHYEIEIIEKVVH